MIEFYNCLSSSDIIAFWGVVASFAVAVVAANVAFRANRISRRSAETSLKLASDQMLLEFFRDFNSKYDQLNETLYWLESRGKSYNYNQLTEKQTRYTNLMDYFNLCAEERFWRKKGRIPDDVWRSWSKGMVYWFKEVKIVRDAWEIELTKQGYESFYLEEGEVIFEDPLGKISHKEFWDFKNSDLRKLTDSSSNGE